MAKHSDWAEENLSAKQVLIIGLSMARRKKSLLTGCCRAGYGALWGLRRKLCAANSPPNMGARYALAVTNGNRNNGNYTACVGNRVGR